MKIVRSRQNQNGKALGHFLQCGDKTLCAIFFVTAAILIWVGFVVQPDDRAAMEGFTRLMFTVIPIPLFSWTAATVFTILGIRIARRTLRTQPTLIASQSGLTLPSGAIIPWLQVKSAEVAENSTIKIAIGDPDSDPVPPHVGPIWRRWFGGGTDEDLVILSSFELGADPATVAEELERRRASVVKDTPV